MESVVKALTAIVKLMKDYPWLVVVAGVSYWGTWGWMNYVDSQKKNADQNHEWQVKFDKVVEERYSANRAAIEAQSVTIQVQNREREHDRAYHNHNSEGAQHGADSSNAGR